MTARLGATAQEWAAWGNLGLTADLLPVVSDTSVEVSPKSKLKEVGKVPSIINGGGHVSGLLGWTQHQATEKHLARWADDDRIGICLIGRQVKGIDIDIPDPARAAAVRDLFVMLLGEAPLRQRANSGKCLLAYRIADPIPKWRFSVDGGFVELLGPSQQFVVAGTHPSGARYEWAGGVPSEFPTITAEQLGEAWATVFAAFGIPGTDTRDRQAGGQERPRIAEDSSDFKLVNRLWERGRVVEQQGDGSLCVVCPWQNEHTDGLAGAPSSTVLFPAGVGAEKRGFKCLHAHCAGKGIFDYLRAEGIEAEEIIEEFEVIERAPVPAPAVIGGVEIPHVALPFDSEADWPNWPRDKKGNVEVTTSTIIEALQRPDICNARIVYDTFQASLMICWRPGTRRERADEWRRFADEDIYWLRVALEKRGFKVPSKEIVRDAAYAAGRGLEFDSAVQWVKTLKWDGVPRVEQFYADCWGVPDTPYARAVGAYTWSALAGRALVPGCKADMVPVFIGAQGAGKTTGVKAMSPREDMFAEIALDIHDNDLARKMRGKLVGELGELRGLSGKDSQAIKNWVSRSHEEWTQKYQEFGTVFPRRLIFFGTANSNNKDFLDDDSGERRWLPMEVGKVDVKRIRAEREQLWAEGAAMFLANGEECLWEPAERLATVEHAGFKAHDVWEDQAVLWLTQSGMDDDEGPLRGDSPFKTLDILVGAIGMRVDAIRKIEQNRISKVLRNLGYETRVLRVSGQLERRWVKITS